MYKEFDNVENMSIREIDDAVSQMESGETNPLHKTESADVSDRIKSLAHALMQLGYLDEDPGDTTLLKIAKILGIDTRSLEPKAIQKSQQEDIFNEAARRTSARVQTGFLLSNPDELANTSIKDIDAAIAGEIPHRKRPW